MFPYRRLYLWASNIILTKEVGEPWRLVIVDDGNTHSVKSHQTQDDPVEGVGLDHVADGDAQHALLTAEVR